MQEKKTAVITGASRGIGRAIARELAEAGYAIVGISRTDSCEAGESLQGDISDLSQHQHLVERIVQRFGRIDLLVNNAGVAPEERQDLLETSPESFDRVLGINLRGPFFFSQAVARQMEKQDFAARIVFIGSISAAFASSNRPEYCISKAGLSMVSSLFAQRLAGQGIAVYEIRPGLIRTEMTAGVREQYDQRIADGLVPLNRWGEPEDVARAVRALAEGALAYSTGSVLDLSGGLTLQRL